MTAHQEIHAIANQIANEGKQPSVALIKSKLTSPKPLPVIISALKSWTHEPKFTQVEDSKKTHTENLAVLENTVITEAHIHKLIAEAIKPLQNEIAELKAIIANS